MQFLADIFPDDEELVAFVQKVVGYLLTGSTKEHILASVKYIWRSTRSYTFSIITDPEAVRKVSPGVISAREFDRQNKRWLTKTFIIISKPHHLLALSYSMLTACSGR